MAVAVATTPDEDRSSLLVAAVVVTAPDACPVVAPDDWAVVLTDWASAADCDASSAARVAPPKKRSIPIMPARIASIETLSGVLA
ncbi:hypothetical protein LRM48_001825 [Candidatus Nanosynbacter sp. TM7-008]|uniref:hypothetical protein n=1 Tax=Candidatus Nanosynbacter sp. TM7-008 TaxID=2902632 RepID=UPI001FB62FAA|nr:hypothetical protein [Candidatus Nanosynbacter sp. TM7-008]MCJ1964255.1 hypothetical protein [Candidatus Nanosynbacter sp. TM7-008]